MPLTRPVRQIASLIFALGVSLSAYAQVTTLADYRFTTPAGGSSPSLASSDTDPNSTASNVARVGMTFFPIQNVLLFAGSGTSLDLGRYAQFTVTPSSGNELDLAKLSFQAAGNQTTTGGSFAVYYSIGADPFAELLGATSFRVRGTANLASGAETIDLAALGSTFQNITSSVSFRFYAWENTGAAAIKGYMDNLVLTGEALPVVTPVPEPSSLALMATGLLGLGALRRRRRQGT